MRPSRRIMLGLLALALAPTSLRAASTIDRWVISSGGGTATSATFTAFTVIGEPLAGPATSATYAIQAGFLPGALSGTVPTEELPTANILRSIAPNPFQESVAISFDIATSSQVTARVFDASGRLVQDLANRVYSPGRYSLTWDGTSIAGSRAPAGVYYCQFRCGAIQDTRHLVFIK